MTEIFCDFSNEIEIDEWVCDFSFGVVIMQKMIDISTKLLDKGVVIHHLYIEVTVFN